MNKNKNSNSQETKIKVRETGVRTHNSEGSFVEDRYKILTGAEGTIDTSADTQTKIQEELR
jgi:hypothetical protein